MVSCEMTEQVCLLISSGMSHCVPEITLLFWLKDHIEALLTLPSRMMPFFTSFLQYGFILRSLHNLCAKHRTRAVIINLGHAMLVAVLFRIKTL